MCFKMGPSLRREDGLSSCNYSQQSNNRLLAFASRTQHVQCLWTDLLRKPDTAHVSAKFCICMSGALFSRTYTEKHRETYHIRTFACASNISTYSKN